MATMETADPEAIPRIGAGVLCVPFSRRFAPRSGVQEHVHCALDEEQDERAEQRGLHDGRRPEDLLALRFLAHAPEDRRPFRRP